MPYKSEKIKIEGTKLDRRRKLTEDQKEYIRWLREEEGLSQRKLATMFGVSRRLITYIIDPEKEKRNKAIQKQHRQEGRYKYTKEQWAEVMREHRHYKEKLHKDGLI
jgi:ribosome-binding protein aMBF1 (putative translation factor)